MTCGVEAHSFGAPLRSLGKASKVARAVIFPPLRIVSDSFCALSFSGFYSVRMYKKPRRILLKFGSGILTRPRANALDEKQFGRLTADVAQLVRGGFECI